MNIFDYAMQIEKEGVALYKEFAQSAPNKGMAVIFKELAEQEKKHFKAFKIMKNNRNVNMTDMFYLKQVKKIFGSWLRDKDRFKFDTSQADLYRKALDVEKKSIDFYTEKSKEIKKEEHKRMFLVIADEEKKHYDIIENIIEFMIKPERWVEHAEFSKIGEQY